MRRSFVLLVITAVLLAICCAESASADQTKPVQSGDTALGDDNAGRLSRSHQEADDDTGIADEDRGLGSMLRKVFGLRKSGFAKRDLMKALKDENSRVALYKKWDKYPV
ncbi:hypothetical protein PF005_g15362 [Phytophthora fragariae]|uniref:RxLR effector protein n=2 Tax=Phytophthora TaxID=4783 RepID=A0A6A3XD16_9STRA|nr:hypothetical protein PF003_g36553 [Phytophthora fragariae]KAE9032432.1 hypothetical protein PR002_g9188 [Phytophthora rubi]KAE8933434.1 hypothetical protein PF009_g16566 [Phytophthora fragariae]KAE8993012.1 hypothetical protein PF011_g17316 [Phytophthora fragariae]KAE9059813.1 hypothetical protein PF010_g30471 [Phytophthora fragariae]